MPVREHIASDSLKTPEDAAAYLNAAIEQMGDDPRLLMKAFRNVAEARGGVSALARRANLDRRRPLTSSVRPTKSAARYPRESLRRLRDQAAFFGVDSILVKYRRETGRLENLLDYRTPVGPTVHT